MYIYQVINEFTSELEELSLLLWLTELSTITFLNLILVVNHIFHSLFKILLDTNFFFKSLIQDNKSKVEN
jgi:hypothetical protein